VSPADAIPTEPAEFAVAGLFRRARRIADMSQRELALAAGTSASTVGRIEAGSLTPSVELIHRILRVASLWLTAVDDKGRVVQPMDEWDDTRDGAQRRYPSHLDRDRRLRDMQRARSQWEVRVAARYWGGAATARPVCRAVAPQPGNHST
jgi:transcriptional regulator with XRE-family HTH domain